MKVRRLSNHPLVSFLDTAKLFAIDLPQVDGGHNLKLPLLLPKRRPAPFIYMSASRTLRNRGQCIQSDAHLAAHAKSADLGKRGGRDEVEAVVGGVMASN